MNPLFRNFYNAIKDAVRTEIAAVKAAKLLAQSGRRDARARVEQAKRDIVSMRGRTSANRPTSNVAWDRVMRTLGPLGSAVGAMLRPQARSLVSDVNKELKAAAQLMASMGYDLTPEEREIARTSIPGPAGGSGGKGGAGGSSGGSGPSVGPGPTPGGSVRSRETPPIVPLSLPGERQRSDVPDQDAPNPRQDVPTDRQSEFVVKIVNGRRYKLRRNSPMLTGEMIRVKSSNVHSIGYIWNDKDPAHGTLCVRFLDHKKGRETKAGAGYQYFRVHPELFAAFVKASSKGKFVWDKLRVRGTVSGHQFQYSIATLGSDGYVPRKARRVGDHEWYLKRSVRDTSGRVHVSTLPKQLVGRYQPRPNNGGPNRGGPNRGR